MRTVKSRMGTLPVSFDCIPAYDWAIMAKYGREIDGKVARAKGSNMRVHFKNTRETAKAIKGMPLKKAQGYLQSVIEKKRCIVFRRFCGGVGRTPLAKNEGSTNGQVRYFVSVVYCVSRWYCAWQMSGSWKCRAASPRNRAASCSIFSTTQLGMRSKRRLIWTIWR